MSKEQKLYRILIMIYVLIIANILLFVLEGVGYYLWFLSSILLLGLLLISERNKIFALIKSPKRFKISSGLIYLLVFFLSYPRHYQSYRHLNYALVVILQVINVIFFFLLFCIKEKDTNLVLKKD